MYDSRSPQLGKKSFEISKSSDFVINFKISLRFLDFNWDFKISGEISRFPCDFRFHEISEGISSLMLKMEQVRAHVSLSIGHVFALGQVRRHLGSVY